MGVDRSLWAPPAFDFRFLNRLPSPLQLVPGKTQISESPSPPPSSSPNPKCPDPNVLFHLISILSDSLQSALPSRRRRLPTQAPLPPKPREAGCFVPLFRPYVARVPWHGGVRAFLSQLFPRYGHYCGPNWSSGKAGGSMLWDRRPLDWLDFCCYCHDIGYDSHDQAKLLRADLAFLECLERPQMATKGGAYISLLYRSMCITGLRYILIPYRMQVLRLQAGPSVRGNTKEKERVPEDGGAQMGESVNRGSGGRFCPRQPEKHTEI
ncbi:hypothetical protein AXF42_Ash004508 [Apostasia shenzhenica]|uniref:Phospholipase A(2) n=1 Tax=Apostasia shenzhenica TaxID=1088818 RepID=A0A2I0BGU1_9ASPA|nr:hypothetical protein AXF42_Ash004508 [Apostasia shenzhenica]